MRDDVAAAVQLMYEWALSHGPDVSALVTHFESDPAYFQLDLQAPPSARLRKCAYQLLQLGQAPAGTEDTSQEGRGALEQAVNWFQFLLREVGAETDTPRANQIDLELRTQAVLQQLKGSRPDWKAAKQALQRLFLRLPKSRPALEDRRRLLAVAIEQAQRRELDKLEPLLTMHSLTALQGHVANFFGSTVEPLMPKPTLESLRMPGQASPTRTAAASPAAPPPPSPHDGRSSRSPPRERRSPYNGGDEQSDQGKDTGSREEAAGASSLLLPPRIVSIETHAVKSDGRCLVQVVRQDGTREWLADDELEFVLPFREYVSRFKGDPPSEDAEDEQSDVAEERCSEGAEHSRPEEGTAPRVEAEVETDSEEGADAEATGEEASRGEERGAEDEHTHPAPPSPKPTPPLAEVKEAHMRHEAERATLAEKQAKLTREAEPPKARIRQIESSRNSPASSSGRKVRAVAPEGSELRQPAFRRQQAQKELPENPRECRAEEAVRTPRPEGVQDIDSDETGASSEGVPHPAGRGKRKAIDPPQESLDDDEENTPPDESLRDLGRASERLKQTVTDPLPGMLQGLQQRAGQAGRSGVDSARPAPPPPTKSLLEPHDHGKRVPWNESDDAICDAEDRALDSDDPRPSTRGPPRGQKTYSAIPAGGGDPSHSGLSTKAGHKPDRNQRRVKWTQEEEEYLRRGVARYGLGSWAAILHTYAFDVKRSSIDLKDKWRNMEKRGEC